MAKISISLPDELLNYLDKTVENRSALGELEAELLQQSQNILRQYLQLL